ncbi:MAG: metal ABC transporter permease [Pseudomonadota bacterium]
MHVRTQLVAIVGRLATSPSGLSFLNMLTRIPAVDPQPLSRVILPNLHIGTRCVLSLRTCSNHQAHRWKGTSSITLIWSTRMLFRRSFDPAHASVIGLPVRYLHFGLLILLALTIVASLNAAGVILVIAMLIAPGAIGFMLTRSFDEMLIVALCVSLFSCFTGMILSFHFDTATSPLIVVIQAGLFILALVFGKNRSPMKVKNTRVQHVQQN